METRRKNIVTIGGGTGSFTLLNGLKNYDINLSAIVSMADDGGSTGILRDELGVLPPGDVRQCLVALSNSSETVRELMSYRFEEGGLKGHSFGNLLLSALEKMKGTFAAGVEEAAKILNIQGEVVPVTEDKATLCIRLKNGDKLEGENRINHSELQKIGIEKIYYNSKVKANLKALEKIKQADAIVIGPGNFFCSILPNLIIKEFAEAIGNSKAKVIFNCNLTNKKGQTESFGVDEYVEWVEKYIGKGRVDYVTFNFRKAPRKLVEKYEKQEGKGIMVKFNEAKKRSYKLVEGDIISLKEPKFSRSDVLASKRAFIRHDSDKLAKLLMLIVMWEGYKKIIKGIL